MRAALLLLAWVAAMLSSALARAESPLVGAARVVARDLGVPPRTVLVVASPLTSDVAATRGDELASRMASLVAGALGGEARAEARPMSLVEARTRAGSAKATAVVYLDVRIDSGELRLTADLYRVIANGWDRVRTAPPPASAHAFVHSRVAAEVRSYLVPIHLERARLKRFTHDAGSVLALACGDLDGSGGNGLALVSAREVVWGYLEGGRYVAQGRAAATALGRRAAVPMREPMASAAIVVGAEEGLLFVGWTGRGGAVVGPDLKVRARIAGLPVMVDDAPSCLVADSPAGGFERLVDCASGVSRPPPPTQLFDAWSASDVSGQDGAVTRVVAARDPSAVLHLTRSRDSLAVSDVGAQVAVADLDEDGVVEVVTTAAAGEDALIISSWGNEGLVPRLRFAAPGGVDAVAICPAEADDAPSVVAAVGSEIWLVH